MGSSEKNDILFIDEFIDLLRNAIQRNASDIGERGPCTGRAMENSSAPTSTRRSLRT